MTEENTMQEFGTHMGRVLRFFNRKGYGFIQDLSNDETYFVHNKGITVSGDIYRKLYPGEYVSYNLVEREGKQVCSGVRGIMGYPLLVENEDHMYRVFPKESRRVYGYTDESVVGDEVADNGSDNGSDSDSCSGEPEPEPEPEKEFINKEAPEGIEVAEFDGLNINEEMG